MVRNKAKATSKKGTITSSGDFIAEGDEAKTICYCNGERDLSKSEVICHGCKRWFHGECIKDAHVKEILTYAIPFMICYQFICSDCAPIDKKSREDIERKNGDSMIMPESWNVKNIYSSHMLITALANMTYEKKGRRKGQIIKFSLYKEIIPYVDEKWHMLTVKPKEERRNTWKIDLKKAMLKHPDVFISEGNDEGPEDEDMLFGLKETDLSRIGPHHESLKILSRKAPSSSSNIQLEKDSQDEASDGRPKTRGSRRKAAIKPPIDLDLDGVDSSGEISPIPSKKTKKEDSPDFEPTKGRRRQMSGSKEKDDKDLKQSTETPFACEDYRYTPVEPDPVFELYQSLMPKLKDDTKIPSYLYRAALPEQVCLSFNDRARDLKYIDKLTITGTRGYQSIRSSHCVREGTWYYEVYVVDLPDTGNTDYSAATRIGFCQAAHHVKAPVGYEIFGYSMRSRKGTLFHNSRGTRFPALYPIGYGKGDTIGCLIHLPKTGMNLSTSSTYKDKTLVTHRSVYWFEIKSLPKKVKKDAQPLPGSYIAYFKNGQPLGPAFKDLISGEYFAGLSIFQNATLKANFGPTFKYAPKLKDYRPFSDLSHRFEIEQTVADLLYFAENV